MSAISPQAILDESKFRTIKTQHIVVLNDDEIDNITLSLANESSRLMLWIDVSNLGQIDLNASEELKIFDNNDVFFQIPLNNSLQAFTVPVEKIDSFNTGALQLEVTVNGQRSNILGPWIVTVNYT